MSQVHERAERGKKAAAHPLVYVFGLLGFCTFLATGYFLQLVSDPQKFPIKKIAVDGEFLNLQPVDVEDLVSSAVVGGFFNLDVEHLQGKILTNPWIESVSVRRIWPDSIRVSIREQDPVAYWGEHALLNEQADIFAPAEISRDAPLVRLSGPIGTEAMVLEQYWMLAQLLGEIGMKISMLEMNERRSWQVTTTSGVVIKLGRDQLPEKLSRLKTAYRNIPADQWQQVSTVDLRYTNGLTVRREGTGEQQIAAG